MKNNYKMIIAYDGTRYYGWEHQPNTDMTIQGKLESVLSQMTGEQIDVIGAGRTDAGVHAKGMAANAHMQTSMTPDEICDYMNRYLPEDICVMEVRIASERFHSRYNAMGKTYCYTCYVGDKKPVFNRKYVHITGAVPDVEAMKKAASYLVGVHDFASFCSANSQAQTTVRTIYDCTVSKAGDIITIRVTGNGFLYNMVRIIAGTLVKIGGSDMPADAIKGIIAATDRAAAGPTAPAHGLTMIGLKYE